MVALAASTKQADMSQIVVFFVAVAQYLCAFLAWILSLAANAYIGFREALQSNHVLDEASLWTQLKIRFVCAVAVFAFENGIKQSARSFDPKKRAQLGRSQSHSRSRVSLQRTKGQSSVAGGAAVVVPVLVTDQHHLRSLRQTLECIARQIVRPEYVYVVDDGSPLPLASQLTDEEKEGLTIIRSSENEGPAAARNRGLEAARVAGVDYVCFTDSDCLPAPTWIENIVTNFRKQPDVDILGGITAAMGKTLVEQYHDSYGTLNGRLLPCGMLLYAPTCNMSLRLRTVHTRFNPAFREAAFEDVDFSLNARDAGASIKLAEDVIVGHQYNSSVRGLFRQLSRYGRSFPLFLQLHRDYSLLFCTTKIVPSEPILPS